MAEAITHILVPVDFSAPSDRALRYASTLAERFGASVELLLTVRDTAAPDASERLRPEHRASQTPPFTAALGGVRDE